MSTPNIVIREMAALNVATNIATVEMVAIPEKIRDKIGSFQPPKQAPVVVFQSVPVGTTVPRGTSIGVRMTSLSDVPIIVLAAVDRVPVSIETMTAAEVVDFGVKNPELITAIKAEGVLENPEKVAELSKSVATALKRTIPESESRRVLETFAGIF